MSYIYVKDAEGFVIKKLAEELQEDEIIITKEEYEKLSGDTLYKRLIKKKSRPNGRREG